MAHTQKAKVVIMFDWDNTIMFSGPFLQNVFQATAKAVEQTIKLKKEIPAIFTKKREAYLDELFGSENVATIMPIFESLYAKMFDPKSLSMFPGARELIEKLTAAKIPVAIVSNYTEVGIKEHLDLRNIDHSDVVIIGVDTIEKHKPDVAPGVLALNKLHIDLQNQPVHVIMIGDGMDSDMVFAKNMDVYLKQHNPNSRCQGMLYNASFNDDSIFSLTQIQDFLEKTKHPKEMISYGYGRLFSTINHAMNPIVSEQQLMTQHQKLRVLKRAFCDEGSKVTFSGP